MRGRECVIKELNKGGGYFTHLIVVLLGKERVAPTYTPIRCEKFRYETDI